MPNIAGPIVALGTFPPVAGVPRVTTVTFGATTTINCDTTDVALITATGNITSLVISGTPVSEHLLRLRISASGADRTVAFGSSFRIPSSSSVASPVTIASGTATRVTLAWRSDLSKWDIVSLVPGY